MDRVDSSQPGENEVSKRVSNVALESVEASYGEKTWRPVQSVIDIIQNHLDANTSVYEKGLLGLVGVTNYQPDSKEQQTTKQTATCELPNSHGHKR